MRVGGPSGTFKAGSRITMLCKHFAVEGLRGMGQKKKKKKSIALFPLP